MNKITTNTIAFWCSILLANLWYMNGDKFLAAVWLIGMLIAMWNEYNTKDTK